MSKSTPPQVSDEGAGRTSSTGRSRSRSAARRGRSPARSTGCRCPAARCRLGADLDLGARADRALHRRASCCAGGARTTASGGEPGGGLVSRAPRTLLLALAARARRGRARPRPRAARGHRRPTAARSWSARPARSCCASASRWRSRSAPCACSTRRAARSSAARPFHRRARTTRSRSACATAFPTAATRRPTGSISADSHPVSGGFVFSVGKESAAPASSVAELLGDQRAGPGDLDGVRRRRARPSTRRSRSGSGCSPCSLLVWPAHRRPAGGEAGGRLRAARAGAAARRRRGGRRWRRWSRCRCRPRRPRAARSGTRSAARARCSTRASGSSGASARLAWIVAGRARRRPRAARAVGRCRVLALALLPGLGGHAGSQDPVAVLLTANVLHVLAAGAWIGGLAVLVLALPAATRRLEAARADAPAGRRDRALLDRRADLRRRAAARRRAPVAAGAVRRRRPVGHRRSAARSRSRRCSRSP